MRQPKDKVLRIGVSGASGRVGKILCEILSQDDTLSPLKLGDVLSRKVPNGTKKLHSDLVIDFSHPSFALQVAKLCAAQQIPLLVCTTGFSNKELSTLKKILGQSCWALVPNTSLGVYALKACLERAAHILKEDFDEPVIFESHHKHKKDSPSGTALMLQKSSALVRQKTPEQHIFSVRSGTDAGTHRIDFYGPFEELHLSHQAQDRKVFALGALRIAKKLYERSKSPLNSLKYPLTLEDFYQY